MKLSAGALLYYSAEFNFYCIIFFFDDVIKVNFLVFTKFIHINKKVAYNKQ